MTDLDKMARELLDSLPAASCGVAADFPDHACVVLESEVRYAIAAALLTAPPGWKLVPVEPTDEMETANAMYGDTSDWWNAVITAAPEPKP